MPESKKESYLVTGGAGFIGSHLVERLLSAGHNVDVLDSFQTGDRNNLPSGPGGIRRLIEQDVTEPFSGKYNGIFHLACPASPVHYQASPIKTFQTAVWGTHQVLENARMTRARVVIASTSEVYGNPLEHPQTEAYFGNVNPIGLRSCYDEGKRGGETLAMDYARVHGVDARIVRIFNTYGPRMLFNDGRVVSNFCHQALIGKPLTVYGNGDQTRSFCFVSDMVEGLIRAMEVPVFESPVNLGNPDEYTVLELAKMVLALLDANLEIRFLPLPSDDPARRKPDISKARHLLSWEPLIPVQEGILKTIQEFRTRLANHGA
ncbi:MAG: UDP-glucuronic acid decarboxylase family protein [Leptospirales bacterium]